MGFNPADSKLNTLVFESRSQIETPHPLMSKHSTLPCRRLKHSANYSGQPWCRPLSLLTAETLKQGEGAAAESMYELSAL